MALFGKSIETLSKELDEIEQANNELIKKYAENSMNVELFKEKTGAFGLRSYKIQTAIFNKTSVEDINAQEEQLKKALSELPEVDEEELEFILQRMKENQDLPDINMTDMKMKYQILDQRRGLEKKIGTIHKYFSRTNRKKTKIGKPYKIAVFVTIATLATLTLLMKLFPN